MRRSLEDGMCSSVGRRAGVAECEASDHKLGVPDRGRTERTSGRRKPCGRASSESHRRGEGWAVWGGPPARRSETTIRTRQMSGHAPVTPLPEYESVTVTGPANDARTRDPFLRASKTPQAFAGAGA